MAKIRCKTSFYDLHSGFVFPAGALVDSSNPVVARNPHLFDSGPVVEQATAAPGEKRARRTPAKKAAPKAEG